MPHRQGNEDTATELIRALGELNARTHQPVIVPDKEKDGMLKHIATGVAALLLSLVGWMCFSISTLNTQMATLIANFGTLQKNVADVQGNQTQLANILNDLKASDARQDAKIEANGKAIINTTDRIRILEGQPPLAGASDAR